MVLALEGGHDLTAICDASEACLNALLGNERIERQAGGGEVSNSFTNLPAMLIENVSWTTLQLLGSDSGKYWKSVEPYFVPVSCKLAETQKQEREETEAVSAMALLSVDVEQSFPQEPGRYVQIRELQ
ncbi:hypothetical protein lerEdw1_020324, partial [Lerista edwardsae]